MKKQAIILSAACLMMVITGCASQKPSMQTMQKPVSYAYAPVANDTLAGKHMGLLHNIGKVKDRSNGEDLGQVVNPHMQQGMIDIIESHGGQVVGSFGAYDEIPFGDKEKALLLLEPNIEISLKNSRSSVESAGLYGQSETGTYVATASGVLKYREPLTNEVVMIKRFDVSSTSQPYTHTYKTGQDGGLLAMAAAAGVEETDNRTLRRNEAVESLYKQLIIKLDAAIDGKEIDQHQADIARLKTLKRF